MNVFIDTSVRGCNVAFFNNEKILACAQEDIERGHAETLLPLYERLMTSLGISSKDIKSVYVTVGPGSFTGLRVGLTVARFIGFSLKIPVYGVTSFQAFSSSLMEKKDRLVLIETKRSDYYCQLLSAQHQALSEPTSISSTEVTAIIQNNKNVMITGDAVNRFVSESNINNIEVFPQIKLNVEKIIQGIIDKKIMVSTAEPFYIRDADVSTPK